MNNYEERHPDLTLAETPHFRVHGRGNGDRFLTLVNTVSGLCGPAIGSGFCYFPEFRTLVQELHQELDDLLLEVTRHPNPGNLGQHRIPVFETALSDRRGLSLRFAIFKRDNYRCQICGRTAADHGAVLEVDHKIPRAKGGTEDIANLWTLCFECNRGKSDTYL